MISILMPCHNCECWVEETLRSVYAQTYTDWELIAADDGSTDGTPDLLRRHAAANAGVRVLTWPGDCNRGVAETRNLLLDHACGEYVVFLDSDDLLPPYALEVMLASLLSEDADIVEGDVREFRSPDKAGKYMDRPAGVFRSRRLDGRRSAGLSLYQNGICASLWGKLYRRRIFDGIRFPAGEIYEDLSVFYRIAERARVYLRIKAVVYLYRLRDASLIHRFSPDRLVVLDVTERIEMVMEERRDAWLLAAAFNMLGHLLSDEEYGRSDSSGRESLDPERRRGAVSVCRDIIKSYSFASVIGKDVRLKNRIGALMALLLPRFLAEEILRRTYRRTRR